MCPAKKIESRGLTKKIACVHPCNMQLKKGVFWQFLDTKSLFAWILILETPSYTYNVHQSLLDPQTFRNSNIVETSLKDFCLIFSIFHKIEQNSINLSFLKFFRIGLMNFLKPVDHESFEAYSKAKKVSQFKQTKFLHQKNSKNYAYFFSLILQGLYFRVANGTYSK